MTWLWWTAMVGVSVWTLGNLAFLAFKVWQYRRMDEDEKAILDFRGELDFWNSSLFVEDADVKEDK